MTKKEFNKYVELSRKTIGKEFGFKKCSYISYKVVDGYFVDLCILIEEAVLSIKPLYLDDLWWDMFRAQECRKAPLSLRGIGAFAISGIRLGDYPIFKDDYRTYSEEDIDRVWTETFTKVEEDIRNFIAQNPSADKFIAPYKRHYELFHIITLIHNNREQEAVEIIHGLKEAKVCCQFGRFDTENHRSLDGYDFILNYLGLIEL